MTSPYKPVDIRDLSGNLLDLENSVNLRCYLVDNVINCDSVSVLLELFPS